MSAVVTLHVFSGRPNPVWILTDDQSAELAQRIGRLSVTSNLKAVSAGGLGYRGFSILDEHGSTSLFINAGIVDLGQLAPSLLVGDKDLENWLLATAGSQVPDEIRHHVQASLAALVIPGHWIFRAATEGTCPKCVAADAPTYNPTVWNTPSVQPRNNCYNYANNQITNTFAQPGRATGKPITALSCQGVTPSAQSDGLVPSVNFATPLSVGAGWYVALVIWPGYDYHWYRQDNVGCWSHKPGQTAARNTDNSGKAIVDPKSCDRGPYTAFCTYMVTKKTVHIS